MTSHHCLAVCAPGVEAVCGQELEPLGVRIRRTLLGGVEFTATDRQLYGANLWLRTAHRIVVRVARFRAASWGELQRGVATVDWERWLADGTAPQVRVSSTASHLSHTGAVAERVRELTARGDADGLLVVVRLMHDRVTVSVDSSGEALYKRGWRLDGANAPMRETLAAAVVLASGWDRARPLVDPLCGSGTIAIEAARLAAGMPPSPERAFAFQQWPCFAPGTWASARAQVVEPERALPTIIASDRDPDAVAAARDNARRAGVETLVDVRACALGDVELPAAPGWIVTNPPYGKRVAVDGDISPTLGAWSRAGWRLALLVHDRETVHGTGADLREVLRTRNGGIPVRLLSTVPDTVAG